MNAPPYRLLASAGTGSAIVEAALELAGLDHVIEEIDYDTLAPAPRQSARSTRSARCRRWCFRTAA